MRIVPNRKLILASLWIVFIIILSVACTSTPSSSRPLAAGTYPIASVFKNYYKDLGGEQVLGPAISKVFARGDAQYQYTVSALLVYNPNASFSQRLQLAAIAREWEISDVIEQQPADPSIPYLNGHRVWEEVLPTYRQWGAHTLGMPLTGVRYNEEKQRYEQYYENLGFYRNVTDSPGQLHFLPYGDWFCAEHCPYEIYDTALPTPSAHIISGDVDKVFEDVAASLYNLTGGAISETYLAPDGYYESKYENVILYADPQSLNLVHLRPLPGLLGIIPDALAARSSEPGMLFYLVQGDLGYNVPQYFWDYIQYHGGLELSGPPITELQPRSVGVSWQCYLNYCLEYHANGPAALRVRPSALGITFMHQNPIQDQSLVTQPAGIISLHVWESYPLLNSGQLQEIGIGINEDGKPMVGVEFTLSVTLPDSTVQSYYLPPTGENGQASIQMQVTGAPNGSAIAYRVCTVGLLDQTVCVEESFLIWDSP